jgi:hypothetical protein
MPLKNQFPPSDVAEHVRWLLEIVDLDEAAQVRGGVHKQTVRRAAERERQLIQLGQRRLGVRRWWAMLLNPPTIGQGPAPSLETAAGAKVKTRAERVAETESPAEKAWRAERCGQPAQLRGGTGRFDAPGS